MKKFFKKNYKFIIKWLVVLSVSVMLYKLCHYIATLDRGYEAIGGEMFMFLIPFFVWVAPEIKKSIKEFKDVLSRQTCKI